MSRHSILSPKVVRYPRSTLLSALGAATLSAFCSVAGAQETPEQLVVQYADLNLSTEQDAKKLYTRLQRASAYVCREFEGREPAKVRLRQKCYDDSLADAVANVDHAVLSALHADKNIRLAQGRGVSQPRS
jgi:UrcA family protein